MKYVIKATDDTYMQYMGDALSRDYSEEGYPCRDINDAELFSEPFAEFVLNRTKGKFAAENGAKAVAVEIVEVKKVKYQVFEGNEPAVLPSQDWRYKLWGNCTFDSFDEALKYARRWCGPSYGGSDSGEEGFNLAPNIPYKFAPGATITIREIPA